jgi:hypothetical protein
MFHTKCSCDFIPWREAYPEYSDAQLIGKALAGARYKEGLTQVQLDKLTGIPQRHISEMENGKRTIYSGWIFVRGGLRMLRSEAPKIDGV